MRACFKAFEFHITENYSAALAKEAYSLFKHQFASPSRKLKQKGSVLLRAFEIECGLNVCLRRHFSILKTFLIS